MGSHDSHFQRSLRSSTNSTSGTKPRSRLEKARSSSTSDPGGGAIGGLSKDSKRPGRRHQIQENEKNFTSFHYAKVSEVNKKKSINNEEDGRTGNPLGDSSEAAPSKRKKRAEIKKEKIQ